jgi:uncharacterized protein YodC (DUF2158 family)
MDREIIQVTVKVSDLIKCYSPPSLSKVEQGNHVMLKSGSREMIVDYVDEDNIVTCRWMDSDGKLQSIKLPLCVLTCYGAK